jgi:hypothetical protein
MKGPGTETISKECVMQKHQWCDGKVKLPEDLVPDGQDGVVCACLCHQGWPGRRRGR